MRFKIYLFKNIIQISNVVWYCFLLVITFSQGVPLPGKGTSGYKTECLQYNHCNEQRFFSHWWELKPWCSNSLLKILTSSLYFQKISSWLIFTLLPGAILSPSLPKKQNFLSYILQLHSLTFYCDEINLASNITRWYLIWCLNVWNLFIYILNKKMYPNLVILLYLDSPFTWDKVLRPLPNHVKNQRLLVHILCYILFSYLDEMLNTMFECEYLGNLHCASGTS